MGVVLIPNQLVKLYKTETFNERNKRYHQDYRTYCQIVKHEQTTMFQLRMTEEGSDLISNGEFSNNLNSWGILYQTFQWSNGQAQGIIISGSGTAMVQGVNLSAFTNYVLEIDIALFAGSADAAIKLISQSGELHSVTISREDYGTTPGRFRLYFYSDAYVHHTIGISLLGEIGDLVYINSVSLYKLTEPVVTLETCEGVAVKTIPVFARGNDRLTYAVEWFGLDDDCYRICITGTEDTNKNHLDLALAIDTEGGQPIELEDGSGYLKWFG